MSPRWSTRHALLPCALSVALAGALALVTPSAPAATPAPPPPPRAGAEMAPGPSLDPAPPEAAPREAAPPANCATTHDSWYQSDGVPVGAHDEIGAEACYTRSGDTARLEFSWGGVGTLHEGAFTFRLVDCAGGPADPRMTYELTPPEGAERGGKGYREFAVTPGHAYRPTVSGHGSYDRGGADADGDRTGHFSPAASPAFAGQGYCR
jgi:hypothetical protein